ncbi:MAG: sigma-70 family RNA polymerase sigma factor [Lentisphaeraceae bacterium]|nr:sigma-70 family RNA polymerase sigma factor [Lentisphaeraceae bacterium]
MDDDYSTRETLVQRLRNSYDEKSWEEFIKYYRGYIYAVVQRAGLSYEDTQDITQDVVLRAWKALPQFEYSKAKCKFRTWLVTLCRNSIYDQAKTKRAKLSRLTVDSDVDLETLIGSSAAEIDEMAEVEWKNYIAEMALESIRAEFSEKVFQTFQLHAEECPVSEIVARLEIPENTVYIYRKRVRKALMKEIFRLDAQLG